MRRASHAFAPFARLAVLAGTVLSMACMAGLAPAVVGPLATFSEPHAYDLCAVHGARLKVPHGWNVIKQELDGQTQGPTEDDLMAIADAVREVALKEMPEETPVESSTAQQQIGRRGHLRAVPS